MNNTAKMFFDIGEPFAAGFFEIESATPAVHTAFKNSLDELLSMQNKIYSEMSAKGWYPAEQAEAPKIAAAKQKFQNVNA